MHNMQEMFHPCKRLLNTVAPMLITNSPNVMRLPPIPTIRDILRIYHITAMKRLSQNFLLEPKLHNKIVNVTGGVKDCHVCEVGPGPGGITRSILMKQAASLVVIEKDRRFLPSLELLAEASDNRMKIILGDVLLTHMENLFPKELARDWEDHPPNIHFIGNLPFNISTPLIIKLLKDMYYKQGLFSFGRVRLTLTFQKEVAERMVAEIVSKQRCRLSVMCQSLCHIKYDLTIPGKAFLPKPEVDVAVVHFVPRKEPLLKAPFEVTEKFVKHVFQFRSKHCKKGVYTLFPPKLYRELTSEIFQVAEVDSSTTSFLLTMDEWDRMINAYYNICQRLPEVKDFDFRAKKVVEPEAQEIDD